MLDVRREPSSAVLTVTCERDRWTFEKQYALMTKLCMPTTWHIVINEIDPDPWLAWLAQVQQQWPCTHLVIKVSTMRDYPHADILAKFNGYWRQQFYKLFATYHLDYDVVVILDSKNWLVKPWHPLMHKIKPREELNTAWSHFHLTKDFCKYLWTVDQLPNTNRGMFPPIAWQPNNVREMLDSANTLENFINCVKWFYMFGDSQDGTFFTFNRPDTISEFLMYDFWMQYKGKTDFLPEENKVNCNYNISIAYRWFEFDWEAFDHLFNENATYWITIKWHVEGEKMPIGLAESIWQRTLNNIAQHRCGWIDFNPCCNTRS